MKKAISVASLVLMAGLVCSLIGLSQDGLAELHVQKIVLDPPSSVVRGAEVQVYSRVTNTGSRNADSFTIGLFYRPLREGESWILLETRQEANLGPSQQDFLEVTFDFPTVDLELGTYEVRVVADVSNQIPETDELNNELATTMVIAASTLGFPELQPTGLSFERIGSSEMDPWQVNLIVENSGEYLLSSFDVQFLVNGEVLTLPTEPATPFIPDAGATTLVVGTLDPHSLGLEPGTYKVTAIIDSLERIPEQDEGNNSITASLTIQTLELRPESLRFDRSVVTLDEEVRLTSEIVNAGSGLAKDVQVDFYVDHLRFATAQISLLGAEPQLISVTLDGDRVGLPDAPKVYEVRVVVDPSNALSESDEANNVLIRTLTILPAQVKKPEVHPESLELTPASPTERSQPDASVTVTSVITNTGRAEAEGFDVGFYYRIKGGRRWDAFPCVDSQSCAGITLAAGEQARLVGVLPLLVLTPGIYEVRVVADAAGQIEELDEHNNELITTLTVLGSRLPDLTISIGSIEPAIALQQGQTARISATVTNVGEEPSEATTVLFTRCEIVEGAAPAQGQQATCADGYEAVAVIAVPALGIGESTTLQSSVETAGMDPGQHRLQMEVNPDRLFSERPDLNNTATRLLSVLGADLLPLPATLRANPSGTIHQSTVDEVGFTVTVANAGLLAAGAFDVVFGLLKVEDGLNVPIMTKTCQDAGEECGELPFFGRIRVSGIGAGAQLGVSCSLDLLAEGLESGQYIVRVYVDRVLLDPAILIDEGSILEHTELNNVAELPLLIIGEPTGAPDGGIGPGTGEGADLAVISVNGRAEPDRILTYGIVRNIGTADSGPFDAEFTVTLPDGRQLKKTAVSLNSIAPGDVDGQDGWNSAQFRLGIDVGFDVALAAGERISVTLRIPQVDANTTNNTGTRTFFVKDD